MDPSPRTRQLLVNEVIRGQLTPKLRMVDMPFQNLTVDNPYLPHKVIEYSSGYYVFERGSFDLKTEIWQGNYFYSADKSYRPIRVDELFYLEGQCHKSDHRAEVGEEACAPEKSEVAILLERR